MPMNITKQNKIVAAGLTGALAACSIALLHTNLNIKTAEYRMHKKNTHLNIVQLSDLHNYEYGQNNKRLINKIKNAKPDIIVMTGDMIDAAKTDITKTLDLIRKLINMCPCIYTEGNHEKSYAATNPEKYNYFINKLKEIGVHVLMNDVFHFKNNIDIYGLAYDYEPEILKNLNKNKFNIVCYHSPVFVDAIAEYSPTLILIGHTHGGQVYIPGIGRLFTHGAGLKAKYISGKNKAGNSTVITSNGLGSSKVHLLKARVNVFPEIVNIKIRDTSQNK